MSFALVKSKVKGARAPWEKGEVQGTASQLRSTVQVDERVLRTFYRLFNRAARQSDQYKHLELGFFIDRLPDRLQVLTLRRLVGLVDQVLKARTANNMWFPDVVLCDGYQVYPASKSLYKDVPGLFDEDEPDVRGAERALVEDVAAAADAGAQRED
ncbi:MAG: hypothetical protein EBQ80_03775 [Proteobacteria bacterium]|nr:hypothetical protein [Bacteroidota bacterium]NBX86346.1 hypothetical protein [Pseudomonadota bacterium]